MHDCGHACCHHRFRPEHLHLDTPPACPDCDRLRTNEAARVIADRIAEAPPTVVESLVGPEHLALAGALDATDPAGWVLPLRVQRVGGAVALPWAVEEADGTLIAYSPWEDTANLIAAALNMVLGEALKAPKLVGGDGEPLSRPAGRPVPSGSTSAGGGS